LDDFIYFTASTYTFVVTGDVGGLFAVNILPSLAGGVLSPSQNWSYPTFSDGACSASEDIVPFATYTWNQTSTGYFDIYAYFSNSSLSGFSPNLVLYAGNVSASTIASSGACSATLQLISQNSNDDGFAVFIPYQNLSATAVYTIAFSGEDYDSNLAYWGVQVIPTRVRFYHSSGFTQPSRDGLPCETSTTTAGDSAYGISTFEAQYKAYLIDTADPPEPFTSLDTYSFLYAGINDGTPPTTCPILAPLVNYGDTGDVTPVFSYTVPGLNYTVVVSTYHQVSSTAATDAYILYTFTGEPIGQIPTTSTGSTASGTTLSAATASTTSGATATGTTSTKTSTTSASTGKPVATTSDASSISSHSVFFIIFVAFMIVIL